LIIPLLTGCHRAPSPANQYADVQQKARHGELDAALKEADQGRRTYSKKNTDWAWRFRVLEAQVLVMHQSNKDALVLLKDDLPPALATSETAVRRKMVQGLASDYLEQYADAEGYFADAESLAAKYDPQLLGDIAMSRGGLEVHEQKYAQAETDFRRALSIAREQKLPFLEAAALGDLGLVTTSEEHYDESIDWNRQALSVSHSLGAKSSEPQILGNMGWSYFVMGDFESALDLTKQAEDAASREGMAASRVYWLSNVGVFYYAEHDDHSAEVTLQKALALARAANNKSTAAECLNDLSLVALDTGRLDQAEAYNKEAADLERAGADRPGVLYSDMVAGRLEILKGHYSRAEQLLQKVIQDGLAETSLRWESEALLGEAYIGAGERAEGERVLLKSIATIEAARASVKTEEFRLSFLSSAISVYSDYIDFLVGQGRTEDALQVAELSRARTLADGLGFNSAKLSFPIRSFQPTKTARALGATILCYWLGAKHSYVWAIDADGVRLVSLPPAVEIDPLVEPYRRALVGPRDALQAETALGEKLYGLLVASAIPKISPGSRVIIIPDGSLYQLNFEALIAPHPAPHYWIDDALISDANSLVLLAASARAKPANSKKLLLVGDPIPATDDFPRLPQAESEMKEVQSYFPAADSTVYSDASATASAYLNSHPDQFSFIHFVAHGTASRTSPLDSAVILSKEGDSYKLYARDIIKRPLHAELVTISACHGAGERTYSGEGLVGLSWAFLHAGAHDVISALWEVDDNSTTQLMNGLYAELRKGAAPEAALRDAKLALLHSDSVYKKPFYWAPFQIYRGP
jgi:CHAT domain-containing protein